MRKWFEDVIPALVKISPTQVRLPAPAHITVGGQQHHLVSDVSLSTAASGAGGIDTGSVQPSKIYYVHAVVSGGSVTLLASLSKTSPSGFTTFKWSGWVFVTDSSSNVAVTTNKASWDFFTDAGFTPSAGFGTVTSKKVLYARDNDLMKVQGYFRSGTVTGASASMLLPLGYSIDSAKIQTGNVNNVGTAKWIRTSGTPGADGATLQMIADSASLDTIYFSYQTVSDVFGVVAVSTIMSSTDGMSFKFEVPILGWSTEL